MDVSKTIAEFLRQQYSVGASHARELAASFLGYNSHAAYIAANGSQWSLNEVEVLIPDLHRLGKRLRGIAQLPAGLPTGRLLATAICADLKTQGHFRGQVLIAENVAEFQDLMDSGYLMNNISLEEELADVMADTNATFDQEYYDDVSVDIDSDTIVVEASGTFHGENDDEADKPNHGDKIDFEIVLKFKLKAWRAGFTKKITASGDVRSPY